MDGLLLERMFQRHTTIPTIPDVIEVFKGKMFVLRWTTLVWNSPYVIEMSKGDRCKLMECFEGPRLATIIQYNDLMRNLNGDFIQCSNALSTLYT